MHVAYMDDTNFGEVYKKTNVALPLKNKSKCKLLFFILCTHEALMSS